MAKAKAGKQASKKRRTRTTHPGVSLLQTERQGWRARWTDPDTGKTKWATMSRVRTPSGEVPTNGDQRREWAEDLSRQLAARKQAILLGSPQVQPAAVREALRTFLASKGTVSDDGTFSGTVKRATFDHYEDVCTSFVDWIEAAGVRATGDLTPAHLERYRDHVLSLTRQAPKKGGKSGAKKDTGEPLSPRRQNALLSGARMLLQKWERLDYLPAVTARKAKDRLRGVKGEVKSPEFLTAVEVQQLLKAAMKHDAKTWGMTREEKARGVKPGEGNTGRYFRIAPFCLTLVLGGFRLSEARALEWSEVDLTAGEIRLSRTKTKTKRDRVVPLDVSPSLWKLLRAMAKDKGNERFVFGGPEPLSGHVTKAAMVRLIREHGAPHRFTWLALRRTCGTYLANAPGIYGGASLWHAAKRLGHSAVVSERHYAGAVSGISADAKTLEAALEIEEASLLVAGSAREQRDDGTTDTI